VDLAPIEGRPLIGTVLVEAACKGRAEMLVRFDAAVRLGLVIAGEGMARAAEPILDGREDSCFVGDFEGDLKVRIVDVGRGAGVGLPALTLLLFVVGSSILCRFPAMAAVLVLKGRTFDELPLGTGCFFKG
jgi:hypothetical protein